MIVSNLTYDESVIRQFPNPETNEYRELIPGELGIAVDRVNTKKVVKILEWMYPEQRHIRIIENNMECIVNSVWYLKPVI